MANQEHLDKMKQGSDAWNAWRTQYPNVWPDLTEADLMGFDFYKVDLYRVDLMGADLYRANLIVANLSEANLSHANLYEAILSEANLSGANLSGADLSYANLSSAKLILTDLNGANLSSANLSHANLDHANLNGANLSEANLNDAYLNGAYLSHANLSEANLSRAYLNGANFNGAILDGAILVQTNLTNTLLQNCSVYGVAAWDVLLDGAEQLNLTITPYGQPSITVDNLKVAQFIYLLLNNAEIREVINTLTTKSVLILGRFTPERKALLDALRDALRQHNYLPILFDFDPAKTQTVRETVRTLAHLSHFIIADLTNSSSIPEELETIIPTLAVPVQPLLELTQKREFSMFKGYGVYPWVLPIYRYTDLEGLVNNLQEKVIEPAIQKARELADKKGHLNQEPFEQTT